MAYFLKMGRLWVIVLLAILAGVIGYSNPEIITIQFPYLRSLNLPTYQVIFVAFVAGLTLSMVYLGIDNLSKTIKIRRLTGELTELKANTQSAPATSEEPKITVDHNPTPEVTSGSES